jgi:hypothetical protein
MIFVRWDATRDCGLAAEVAAVYTAVVDVGALERSCGLTQVSPTALMMLRSVSANGMKKGRVYLRPLNGGVQQTAHLQFSVLGDCRSTRGFFLDSAAACHPHWQTLPA